MVNKDQKSLDELKKELEKFKKGDKIVGRSRTTPLGRLFDKISKKIVGYETKKDVIEYLYIQFDGEGTDVKKADKRRYVINQILDYLDEINSLSAKKEGSNMISIPLYDIRIVGELTNIIIIHGIYSIMPSEYLIPLEQRKLKNFKSSTTDFTRTPFDVGTPILKDILVKLTKIFSSESDLKDLILVGTGFTDTLSIAILFCTHSSEFQNTLVSLESQSSTYQLLSFYSILFKTCKKGTKFSAFVSNLLSQQLMRQNGVESLIDLVLGLREDEEVDIAKINYIVQILINSKPKDVSIVVYYENIFTQIYKLLVYVNRPLMNTILAEIVDNIYNKNKRVIIDFLFRRVWNSFDPNVDVKSETIVLTNETNLNNAFNVCISLIRSLSSTSEQMINEFFEPIFLPLWYYANYQRKMSKDFDIVLNLLKNIVVLGDSIQFLNILVSNITKPDNTWVFDTGEQELTYVKFNTAENVKSKEMRMMAMFDEIDYNVETLSKLTSKLNDSDNQYLSDILTTTLQKLMMKSEISTGEIPLQKVVLLKVIQSLLDNFRAEIEDSPVSLIVFANTYFIQYFDSIKSSDSLRIVDDADSDDEDYDDIVDDGDNDDLVGTMLPILEIITNFVPSTNEEKEQLENLQHVLKINTKSIPSVLNDAVGKIINIGTANLKMKSKSEGFDMETALKQINDPTPSIRVYAVDKLINYTKVEGDVKKSVSTKYTYNLLLSQLKDTEPYVYLNGIKNLVLILEYDNSFFGETLKQYSMSNRSIDEKLRVGEVLTRYVTINGKLLTGSDIGEVVNMCINISRSASELQEKHKDNKDIRLKMSSLSILGLVCFETGFGITRYIDQIADLVHGIITFEESPELRRAAVVIISDIVKNDKGLEIIKTYGERLQTLLSYISEKDEDLLVCQFSIEALNLIDDAFDKRLNVHTSK